MCFIGLGEGEYGVGVVQDDGHYAITFDRLSGPQEPGAPMGPKKVCDMDLVAIIEISDPRSAQVLIDKATEIRDQLQEADK